MDRKIIFTKEAPAPVGPYSQAVDVGGFVFCSGQVPLDALTGESVSGDIKAQTQKVMENIGSVLKAAGLNYSHILKSTIFLVNMGDFQDVNEVYASYFKDKPPARSCVEVSALPKGVDVEIEVLACR